MLGGAACLVGAEGVESEARAVGMRDALVAADIDEFVDVEKLLAREDSVDCVLAHDILDFAAREAISYSDTAFQENSFICFFR